MKLNKINNLLTENLDHRQCYYKILENKRFYKYLMSQYEMKILNNIFLTVKERQEYFICIFFAGKRKLFKNFLSIRHETINFRTFNFYAMLSDLNLSNKKRL